MLERMGRPWNEFTCTGVRVPLNPKLTLSIQTDPAIARNAFAETAIMPNEEFVGQSDYFTIERFYTPEELFAYIETVREKYKDC